MWKTMRLHPEVETLEAMTLLSGAAGGLPAIDESLTAADTTPQVASVSFKNLSFKFPKPHRLHGP